MGIWFTSDEHYGHRNIIQFCKRPFANTEEMQEVMIENHNKLVKAGDLVYHLGDMFWRSHTVEQAIAIRQRLTGNHYYINGNHEELFRHKILRDQFVWCKDTFNLKVAGYPNIWLSHYAHEDWNGSHRGAYHLFGHIHGARPNPVGLKMDVGVDLHGFSPVSFDYVTSTLGKKAELVLIHYWSCENVECKNKFNAVDHEPKICSKCGSGMKLMKKLEGTNQNG